MGDLRRVLLERAVTVRIAIGIEGKMHFVAL